MKGNEFIVFHDYLTKNEIGLTCIFCMIALAKEDGSDPDMAEMISYEIDTLSNQLEDLEDKLKVGI